MNLYETVYVIKQDIRPEDLKPLEEKFENLLRLKKSSIEYKENWGLRNLAYKINKNRKGHYFLLNIDGPPDAIVEYERLMRLDEDVIRFLTVKIKFIDEKPSPLIANKTEKKTNSTSIETDNLSSDTQQ